MCISYIIYVYHIDYDNLIRVIILISLLQKPTHIRICVIRDFNYKANIGTDKTANDELKYMAWGPSDKIAQGKLYYIFISVF